MQSIFTGPISPNFDQFSIFCDNFCSIYRILMQVAQNMQFYMWIVGIKVQVKRSIRSEIICRKRILLFSVHWPKFGTENWNFIFFLIFSKFWLITFYYFYKPIAGCQKLGKVNNWCRTTLRWKTCEKLIFCYIVISTIVLALIVRQEHKMYFQSKKSN